MLLNNFALQPNAMDLDFIAIDMLFTPTCYFIYNANAIENIRFATLRIF